jgi:hypothetical protein
MIAPITSRARTGGYWFPFSRYRRSYGSPPAPGQNSPAYRPRFRDEIPPSVFAVNRRHVGMSSCRADHFSSPVAIHGDRHPGPDSMRLRRGFETDRIARDHAVCLETRDAFLNRRACNALSPGRTGVCKVPSRTGILLSEMTILQSTRCDGWCCLRCYTWHNLVPYEAVLPGTMQTAIQAGVA